MRVLFVSQYFYPEPFLNSHLASHLAEVGHSVQVVCCVPNYPSGRFYSGYSNFAKRSESLGDVRVQRAFTIPRGRTKVQLLSNFLFFPVSASWQIFRLRRQQTDVSFVSMPSPIFQSLAGIFAKRIWGIPTVFWVLDIWPDSAIVSLGIRNRFIARILRSLCGLLYRQADLILVQSDGFHETFKQFGIGGERIRTMHNFAPPTFGPVERDAVPERISELIPQRACTLMFAGNIGESQDLDSLVDAVKLLPDELDLQIIVVGSGRDEARIRMRADAECQPGRFVFLGRHPEQDMPAFFACADAMIVSLRDEEVFALTVPAKVQAYLACGKPILASLAGEGAALIAESGVGFVAPPSSPAALCQVLTEVAAMDKDDLAHLAQRSRALYLERFSLDAVGADLERHLQAAIAGASVGVRPA